MSSQQQKRLFLIPQPGAKPEFLATLQLVDPAPAVSNLWQSTLPETIILEGYTRDGWAWKPHATAWNTVVVESIVESGKRDKLPGFCSYLKERTKCAFGRFGKTGLWVVSYVNCKPKNPGGAASFRMQCQIATDFTQLSGCTLKPKGSSRPQPSQPKANVVPSETAARRPAPSSSSSSSTARSGGGGLLGKLVGAQKRTNQHVAHATAALPAGGGGAATTAATASSAAATLSTSAPATNPAMADSSQPTTSNTVQLKTAQQIFSDFRHDMEQKMLDFDLSSDEQVRVTLSLSEQTANLEPSDKAKVTMDVLKYMVYEAAEEVNEEWVAHKEPSEFMDEAVIVVYKEGAAPPEVLEEMQRGELPDEVRGQQRAIAEERQRQVAAQHQRTQQELQRQAVHAQANDSEEEQDLEALNTRKRDRRTIEDYEREKRQKKVTS